MSARALISQMAANKHTTAAALVGFTTQAVPIFLPELQAKCDALFKLAMIYGFASARDAAAAPELQDQKNQRSDHAKKVRLPILLGVTCLAALTFVGCHSVPTPAPTPPQPAAMFQLPEGLEPDP